MTRAALLAVVAVLVGACGSGSDSPTAPRVDPPTGTPTSQNQLAVIVDMRSSKATKPRFDLFIDGQFVGRIDYRQTTTDCKGTFFGRCFVGGSIRGVRSGKHRVRVDLVAQSGPISNWELIGTVQVTAVNPTVVTNIRLPSRSRRLTPGNRVVWGFDVDL